MIVKCFKLGFIVAMTVPLPSPAEKGDREAVDEESICNLTYWVYNDIHTTMRIEVTKRLMQKCFLGFSRPEKW